MLCDQQLVADLMTAKRDEALTELIARHGRMVERAAQRITHDTSQAEEVRQAVFLVLLDKAAKLTSIDSLGSWLHRAAVYASYKSLRSRARRRKHESEAAKKMRHAKDQAAPALPPEFDAAMARLPDTYREVIIRRFLEQRSRSEIARDLGVNEGAVDMRLTRALERLRRSLSPSMAGLTIATLTTLLTAESAYAAQLGALSSAPLLASSPATQVTALAKGTANTMFWVKVKSALISSVIVAGVAGTATAAIHTSKPNEKSPQADAPAPKKEGDALKPLDPATESAKLKIPLKTWIARPYDRSGLCNKPGARNGSKHLRLALNPIDGLIYCLGGDYGSDCLSDDQLWTYDILADKWERTEPVFGKQGDLMPGAPDEVCWTWDSKRNQFWTSPGFFYLSEAVHGEGGATVPWDDLNKPLVLDGYAVYQIFDYKTGARYTEGKDFKIAKDTPAKDKMTLTNISIMLGAVRVAYQPPGHALQRVASMTYDPFKKKWAEVPEFPLGPRNGAYDPVTDSVWRGAVDANNDLCWTQYDIQNKKSSVHITTKSPSGVTIGTASLASEYIALDANGRKIYAIDPWDYRLLQFDLETKQCEVKAPIPEINPGHIAAARARKWGFADATMPVWDSVNNVLLYPFLDGLGTNSEPINNKWGARPKLLIYHPDTDKWEQDEMKQPEGREIRGNTFFFDELHNCLLCMGGLAQDGDSDPSVTHYFIYRYGDGKAAK